MYDDRFYIKVAPHSGVTLYLAKLHKISQHDNSDRVLLPDHPPKIIHGLIQGTLSCYVLPGISVALQRSKNGWSHIPYVYMKSQMLR